MVANHIQIEVAYATPERQKIVAVRVPAGSSVAECIEKSNIRVHFPEINLDEQKVGIWSKSAKLDAEVRNGDRIEIYRPLIADPKEIRRRRAEEAKQSGRADPVTGGRSRRRNDDTDSNDANDANNDASDAS